MSRIDAMALIGSLERFGAALPAVVAWLSPAAARWKPPSGAWSVLEVCRHLLDEETEDFCLRLRHIVEARLDAWPPIDPEGWARERRYNEGDLAETVRRFTEARSASVAWLRGLPAGTDWSRAYQHPKFGAIHAGDLLSAWAAHDLLHLRQIAKRLFEQAGDAAGPFSTRYAGEWGA